VDTIKMASNRDETARAMSLRQPRARTDDARALLRELFVSAADLCPDETAGTLTVNRHPLGKAGSDRLAAQLAEELKVTETIFPGTKLKMVFQLVSVSNPADAGFCGLSEVSAAEDGRTPITRLTSG
jgi:hypothetical protein